MAARRASAGAASRQIAELAAKLAHDVGKYLTRVARNLVLPLREPLPAPLLAMLVSDLYGPAHDPSRRPHAVFWQHRRCFPPDFVDPRLDRCAETFRALDALQAPVTDGQPAAIAEAARLALLLDADLRDLARDQQASTRRSPARGRR